MCFLRLLGKTLISPTKEFFSKIVGSFIANYKFSKTDIHRSNFFNYKDILNGKIQIGEYSYIGPNGKFYTLDNRILIGKYCSIADNVYVITYNHSTKYITSNINQYNKKINLSHDFKKGDIIIGNDVRIGHNCTILPGVKIGNGAIIGAGSIVTKDVNAYEIVGGNPCKFINHRFSPKTIQYIENLQRRNRKKEELKQRENIFNIKLH